MPTELEELVEFLHHGNTQIRQLAAENLVPFSKVQPKIFKSQQLKPTKDLKLLVKDYKPIAENALTILINISSDLEVLKELAEDEAFLETILARLTNPKEPTANALSMLVANLTKSPSLERLTTLQRPTISNLPTNSSHAPTQLIEIYNLGTSWNKDADYDHLSYVFADLAKYPTFQSHLLTPPKSSSLDPLTSFLPHTTHHSFPRRLGTALLLRNIALSAPDPLYLLQPAHSILPPLLLPLCSADQSSITEEEMDLLPEECQYLPPTHREESDPRVKEALVETIYLLAARGGKEGRRVIRENGGYVVVRELHLRMHEEGEEGEGKGKVREWCEKIVDVLMGDEEASGGGVENGKVVPSQGRVEEIDEEDEDNEIVPIF